MSIGAIGSTDSLSIWESMAGAASSAASSGSSASAFSAPAGLSGSTGSGSDAEGAGQQAWDAAADNREDSSRSLADLEEAGLLQQAAARTRLQLDAMIGSAGGTAAPNAAIMGSLFGTGAASGYLNPALRQGGVGMNAFAAKQPQRSLGFHAVA